jgi:hypothetical protein
MGNIDVASADMATVAELVIGTDASKMMARINRNQSQIDRS